MLIHVKPAERVSAVPGRSGGTIQLPAPPSAGAPNSRSPANGRTAATASNDGWVPSASRSARTNESSGESIAGRIDVARLDRRTIRSIFRPALSRTNPVATC